MPGDTVLVVSEFLDRLIAGEIDAAYKLLSNSAVQAVHVGPAYKPFGGELIGIDAIKARQAEIASDFDYTAVRSAPVVRAPDDWMSAQSRVEYELHHFLTGLVLHCGARVRVRVERGKIVRIDEYHDAPRFESFLNLVRAEA